MRISLAADLGYDSLLSLVYPQSCAVCGGSVESRSLGVACSRCWRQTRIFDGSETLCWKCGFPSTGTVPAESREDVRCHRCDEHAFVAARACAVYEGALSASVLALKREPHVCTRLTSLLIETQSRYPLNQATTIIPVPLHPERERARGFNQAALLAQRLSLGVALPVVTNNLIRVSHTERHRAGMDATDRRKTVADAFQVRNPKVLAGEKVLLVDDVFTTGATVSSCARALLNAGAVDVFVLTLARPLHH
ncbi:MAG TPA: ComF family protein [Pyrinomonadaceae bacterium]|nr:ComF family protein [Pyrinomonadaceae bacterium]